MNDKKSPKISIGITSLVVILTVLCLTIFSVMTLSTAISEKNLSVRMAQAVNDYYAAELACTQVANEIAELWKAEESQETYQMFAKDKDLDCQIDGNKIYFFYNCAIDDGQSLFVGLRLDEEFSIIQWETMSTADWTPDNRITVWDGGDMFN